MPGVYYVDPERLAKAKQVFDRTVSEMSANDIAGVLIEAGLGECYESDGINSFGGDRIYFKFSDLQQVAAAAVLATALHGLQTAPLDFFGTATEVDLSASPIVL